MCICVFPTPIIPTIATSNSGCAMPCSTLQKGDIIQLERKGFYKVDAAYGGDAAKPAVLLAIPDGKARAVLLTILWRFSRDMLAVECNVATQRPHGCGRYAL